jgi:hypothetical protein
MWIKRLTSPVSDLGPADIALRLTAVLLLLRPMGPWALRPLILALAGLALVQPHILKAPATWYAMSALVIIRIVEDWPMPDNHIYLLAYWCLALALALGAKEPACVIGKSSRLLIGFTFLMAVIWKVILSPDYLDGRFFRVTLLTDNRFAGMVVLFGGLTITDLEDNRDLLRPVAEGAELLDHSPLREPLKFRILVAVSTWGLLVIEILLALFFLRPQRWGEARHILLLAFCLVTYAFAPVAGFGWLLLIMGMASCSSGQRWLRISYVAVWVIILFYDHLAWTDFLVNWLGRKS